LEKAGPDALSISTAHHIADQIYQTLTGIKGIFSSRIAYVLVTYPKNKLPIYYLQIADSDGYHPQTIVSSHAPIMSPAWSPDGSQLIFYSKREGKGYPICTTLFGNLWFYGGVLQSQSL